MRQRPEQHSTLAGAVVIEISDARIAVVVESDDPASVDVRHYVNEQFIQASWQSATSDEYGRDIVLSHDCDCPLASGALLAYMNDLYIVYPYRSFIKSG